MRGAFVGSSTIVLFGGFVVSTVGVQLESDVPRRFDTVRADRYYETRTFMADMDGTRFYDIDHKQAVAHR